ncbi:oxygen-insensitive NAD(P)H-dependent nitroreductase NfsB [Paraglaciecola polaris]|uniref:Oxygen-insensitive NAD(P)H nitroreductase n=1 Tax=Paraglaciecola polaris LMG 21857 TaxID=1129793 RepID=K6ZL41_9ALTE|nr:oxygen-insensitive NAD(P)H-dependent nitroreductase NfsB [Paraglaciecola polaris]GAC31042.1 oxygen-insensitive NAD(P)H nitroreductase [Paraglaciecola polaris LMG 21857]|tara:strand:+ start:6287 stop:6940 length:654 start_codon:yes stop_codon:yes gene_type:complete
MNLIEVVKTRYSVKEFDSTKKISSADFEQVKALLRYSPSSVNLQPWHFVISDNAQGKQRISKGTQGFYIFNQAKVLDASHVIVVCARTSADETFLTHILDKEDKDGRFAEQQFRDGQHMGRKVFANIHHYDVKDFQHWMEKQVYLNMGALLLGVAAMGIDAVPMEGIDAKAIDEEFGLREKGFTALAIVALGYRKETDFNASLPKSRLSESEIIELA